MKDSEFKAADNLTLHYKDDVPCDNLVKDAKEIRITKGKLIPEIFVKLLLLNNTSQIDVQTKDSVPILTKEQQKKYGIDIAAEVEKKKAKEPKTFKEVVDKQFPKWDMEKLNKKLGYYIKKYKKEGNSKFKDWTEKEFGENKIDKRKSPDNIIVKILKLQDKGKL
ncbi:hypothetical protein LCGC14_0891760 [marine sediment metagenome]|uniref:Uncharacterized protein n=1 Tax=marine sediment metagenome TaxID=412755 RepID=A0A0F9NZ09_9ZZZZ